MISYPRQQQYRRLGRAATTAVAALGVGLLALGARSVGAAPVAGVLLIVAAGLAAYARHWGRLAGRSRVGARSERTVRRALESLRVDGWRLRHSLPWPGGGDIDHVAIAPADVGLAFAIETKTSSYRPEHVARAAATARWLASRRRRWCPRGVLAVVCLVRARGVERVEDGVLVVSIDRLPGALRATAGARERPAFLAPFLDRRAEPFYADWDRAARETAAILRSAAGRDPYDRDLSDLVGELRHAERGVPHPLGRTQRAFPRHRGQATPPPRRRRGRLSFNRLDIAADHGLTLFTYAAEPGSRSQEALNLLGTWAATADLAEPARTTDRPMRPDRPDRGRNGRSGHAMDA